MTEPTEYPIPLPVTPKMADRMRAAGWRPPARVITTADELLAVKDETIIRDAEGARIEAQRDHRDDLLWFVFGSEVDYPATYITLPATVIWESSE